RAVTSLRIVSERICRSDDESRGNVPESARTGMYMLRGVFIAVWAISLSPIVNQKTPSPSAPKCQIEEKDEIRIVCTYTPSPRSSRGGSPDPGVAITRAVFSGLEPNEASNLHAELTFTNTGTKQISEARTVYLEIDDDAGS